MSAIIEDTKEFVKRELQGVDGSHDWYHIERVTNLALTLAREENIEDLELVQLAALLHDVGDWKYTNSDVVGPEKVRKFLESRGYPKIDKLLSIIDGVSFRKELGGLTNVSPELAVVQDADRLDAIGAIGIARTFTFGGSRKRPLWVPTEELTTNLTKEQYTSVQADNNSSTIAHFYHKLLKLKNMMKTNAGRRIAEERHRFMEQFLEQFYREWKGEI